MISSYLQKKLLRGLVFSIIFVCSCLFHPKLFAITPTRSKDIPTSAKYYAKGRLWYMDSNGQRQVWYEKGGIKAKGKYANTYRVGPWTFYHANGQIQAIGTYAKGKKTGLWKFFYEKKYEEKKVLKAKGHYRNGLREGLWEGFYQNRQLFYVGTYSSGKAHGSWKYFYQNSAFFQEGNFDRGVRIGLWHICVYPTGPCSKEKYERHNVPPPSNLGFKRLRK